jgi:peptide/nickel transport system substrate-binding protein
LTGGSFGVCVSLVRPLLFALLLAASCSRCGHAQAGSTPAAHGGTLVVRLFEEPPSLDKLTDSSLVADWMLERNVLQAMAEPDASKHPDYPLKPVLAERWEISPDGRQFTFHLRHGVLWHDGQPFSGKDVVATVDKIRDPKVRALHLRELFEDLESIGTSPGDDYTVIARYRKPYFLAFRALATLSIYPKHVLDVAGDLLQHPIHRAPVGTGPFKFVQWETGNRIVFARNDSYWGEKPHLDQIVFRIVEDATVAFQLLARHEFDLFLSLTPQQWSKDFPATPGLAGQYELIKFYPPNYNWLGWNEERPFFADRRVRLAMTYLLDREGLRKNILFGLDRPTTCHFYPESSACDQTLAPRPYDPARGAALLDEAGWIDHDGDGIRDKDGVPFRFTFLMNANSTFLARLAPYLQQELAKVGVQMEIKKVDWAVYTELLRLHQFDAASLRWNNNDVVEDAYQVWHSSQIKDGSNYISFRNPRVDQILEEARATLDDARRDALYREMGRILYEEEPYTFLYSRPTLDAAAKRVHGLKPSVTWYDLEDVWVDP